MKNKKLYNMVLCAMFTAIIFVMTRFVAIPVASGYIHLGDCLIYISAAFIGGPWAVFSAVIGEALADITAGWVSYAPATIIIKGFIAILYIICYKRSERILTLLSALMTIPAGLLTIGGYFVADLIIDKAYAVTNIVGNAVQAVCSAIIFIIMAFALDAANIKKKLLNNRL